MMRITPLLRIVASIFVLGGSFELSAAHSYSHYPCGPVAFGSYGSTLYVGASKALSFPPDALPTSPLPVSAASMSSIATPR